MTINLDSPTQVYFIKPVGANGPIKIGVSHHPKARLGQFCAWSPVPLELVLAIPGSMALERRIHRHFADAHSHREWFHATPRLLQFIHDLKTGFDVSTMIDMQASATGVHNLKLADARARRGTSMETYAL